VPEPTTRVLETAVNADLRAALEQERKQVRTLLNEAEQLRRTHAKELEDVKSAVVEQVRARGESATNEARIDTFASTLDRVSEAQLKQVVEALNGQIADVVMNALDVAEDLAPTTGTTWR
jgi:histidinol dehydrogenase